MANEIINTVRDNVKIGDLISIDGDIYILARTNTNSSQLISISEGVSWDFDGLIGSIFHSMSTIEEYINRDTDNSHAVKYIGSKQIVIKDK